MATYDRYEQRSRPLRRDDPLPQSRDDYYLRPTAAARPRPDAGRVGERTERSPNNYRNDIASSQSYRRYDSYPPPLPPDTGRPPRRSPAPSLRKRRSWPPQPICEDEVVSLAKEAGIPSKLLNILKLNRDDAKSRGRIDQEPILEDVPEYINKDERRFTLVPNAYQSDKNNKNLPTPPTSDDEKKRRANRRPSRLNMDFAKVKNEVPEMSNRTASPYSFSKSTSSRREEPRRDGFLSPDSIPTPMDSRSRKQRPITASRSQPSSPRRDSARYSPSAKSGNDYFSLSKDESAIDDSDLSASERPSPSRRNKPATYPPSRSDEPSMSSQTSVVDFAPKPTERTTRRMTADARRNTDTPQTLPTMAQVNVDKNRRPAPVKTSSVYGRPDNLAVPLTAATLQVAADLPLPRSRESSYGPSRGISPSGSTNGADITPPSRSPRASTELSRESSYNNSSPTKPSSVSGSRPSSPVQLSPDSPRLPRVNLDWNPTKATSAQLKSNMPSRLNSAVRTETMPTPRADVRPSPSVTRMSSLPYPVNDGPSTPTAWMPSERVQQYFPDTRAALQPPSALSSSTLSRTASPGPSNASYLSSSSSTRTPRPAFQIRHSTTDLPQLERSSRLDRPVVNDPRRVSSYTTSQAKKDIQALAKKGLPSCPRVDPVAGKSEWYSLVGAPSLDFCPDCIDYFERTIFRLEFRKSPPHSLNTKIQCALGGNMWIRMAFLKILQQEGTDLNLLKDLADIDDRHEPCPGNQPAVRTWYGLQDRHFHTIGSFYICHNDLCKIERLLPIASKIFIPLSSDPNYNTQTCVMHSGSKHFTTWLDELSEIEKDAYATNRPADPRPLIKLVEEKLRFNQCFRDELRKGQLWHFIPSLPQFTVCEECFEDVVEPEIEKGRSLAMAFNRTKRPVYREPEGVSCYLYSSYMRDVFRWAVRKNDFQYLAEEAKRRRDGEVLLLEKRAELDKKKNRLSWEGKFGSDDEKEHEREIAKIANTWHNKYE